MKETTEFGGNKKQTEMLFPRRHSKQGEVAKLLEREVLITYELIFLISFSPEKPEDLKMLGIAVGIGTKSVCNIHFLLECRKLLKKKKTFLPFLKSHMIFKK